MGWVEWATIAVAAVGAVLGVVNTVWALYRDRVRLQVVPLWRSGEVQVQNGQTMLKHSRYAGSIDAHPEGTIGVRVINRGLIDVTIASVGFTPSRWWARRLFKARLVRRVIGGDADNQVRLPYRLAPRESVTLWCRYSGSELDAKLAGGRRVYAATACGLDVYATSRLFRRLARDSARA